MNTKIAPTSYSEALVRSDVFTSVLDYLDSQNALEARKLGEKVAKIEAGNYFKNDFQEKLVLDLDEELSLDERYAILPLKNVAFLVLENFDGTMPQLQRLKFISNKLGKSVKTLKIEFDGQDMSGSLPDALEWRIAMMDF